MNPNQLNKEYKKAHQRIRELTAQVETHESTKKLAVDAALAEQAAVHKAEADLLRQRIGRLEARENQLFSLSLDLENTKKELEGDKEGLHAAIHDKETMINRLREDRDDWRAKAEAAGPRVKRAEAATEQAFADIEKLKEKLVKQEREWKSALANRQAIAAAVPGRRQG